MRGLIGGLVLCLQLAVVADQADYRIFKSLDGREISARISAYDAETDRVRLELKNGKQGWMPLSSISTQDQACVRQWCEQQRFLDNNLLDIRITAEDSGWEHDGNPGRDRETRSTHYSVGFSNNNDTGLKDIQIKYCLYREKVGGISANHYNLEAVEVPAGQSVSAKGSIRHSSFKVDSEDWMNSVVGVRFRFYWTASDGTELTRDACYPEDLSDETFPWKEPEFTKEALAARAKPEVDLTPKNLSEDDIRALAKQYADAWKDHDYQAWRGMLEPFHYNNSDLSEGVFNRYQVRSVNIKRIEGFNVCVQMTYKRGHEQLGWLQFHPSGTLKYTPLLFKHPVASVMGSFQLLYNNDPSWSRGAVSNLREAGVPLFGFDTKSSTDDRQEAIRKILEWLEKNGSTHDVNEPKLAIPEEQFEELIHKARSTVERARFY